MSEDIKTPDTQRQMLYEIWYGLKGSNGEGLFERVRRIEESLPSLLTKDEHEEFERAKLNAMRENGRKKDRIIKVIGLVLSFLGSGTVAGVILLLMRNAG